MINIITCIRRWIGKTLWWYLYLKVKKTLDKNKDLKDTHTGERCFIIGTGSSLNKMDLLRLKGEHVFAVGNFIIHKDLKTIKPEFYVEIEPKINLDKLPRDDYYHSDRYFKTIDKTFAGMNTEMFFNIQWKNYIEQNHLFEGKKVYYFTSDKGVLTSKKLNDDLSKFQSFMDGAIYFSFCVAAYMGFKTVYFIGCDCDWFRNKTVAHFYSNDQFPDHSQEMLAWSNERLLWGNSIALKRWRIMVDHFKKKGIKIYNAGIGGDNDTCERVDFNQVTHNPDQSARKLSHSSKIGK